MREDGTDPLEPNEYEALSRGEIIGAIKLYRERTHCSLLMAKRAIEGQRKGFAPDVFRCCPTCGGTGHIRG